MSQGAFITLVGFVAQDPNIRTTTTGRLLTKLRVGTTPRHHDRATGEWQDGETSYYTVTCWARLAEHARASLHKGEPVIVKGRFNTSSFVDKEGRPRTSVEITADTIGHDLSRGPANYIRTGGLRPPADSDKPAGASTDNADIPADDEEMFDEEAIERFGRDLDHADVAAHALADDPDEDENDDAAQPATATASF